MIEWLLTCVFAAVGIGLVWMSGRKSGAAAEQTKAAERRAESVQKAQEVENEIEALDRDTLKSRARRWVRGPER